MKTLKFRKHLCEQVLSGEKTTTWRLFDDKDISVNDEVSLVVWETQEEFAKAIINVVYEKTLGTLTDEDWEGNGKFSSDQEMYATYTKYYNQKVDANTVVKIIQLTLTKL